MRCNATFPDTPSVSISDFTQFFYAVPLILLTYVRSLIYFTHFRWIILLTYAGIFSKTLFLLTYDLKYHYISSHVLTMEATAIAGKLGKVFFSARPCETGHEAGLA